MAEVKALLDEFIAAQNVHGTDVAGYREAVSHDFLTEPDAFAHYLAAGCGAAPELFPFIDPAYYSLQLELPPTVTPFEHYVTDGARRGLSPTPLFDPIYVRRQVDGPAFVSVFDFLADPSFADVDPHPLFSKRYYRSFYGDVADSGLDPFLHFIRHGWQERRAIHPFFGPREYDRFGFPNGADRGLFNQCLMAAFKNPALSSMQALFEPFQYAQSQAPAEFLEAPLQHFLCYGSNRQGSPFPLFDQQFYLSQKPDVRNHISPYVEYLSDFSHRFSPSEFFDPEFYLQSATVDPTFKGSLLEHFVRIGAAQGIRPHRLVAVTHACPSIHSGLGIARTFADLSGNRYWLCRIKDDEVLTSSMDELRDIEPALSSELLVRCSLHAHSGSVNLRGRLLVDVVRKVARCNCLVVSCTDLDASCIDQLFSSAHLVSSPRPWLTLLASSGLTVKYWHQQYGCKSIFEWILSGDLLDKVSFIASVLLASIPNRLVVTTDRFGVALLRVCGPQILATVPMVSMLVGSGALEPEDQQWLREFIASNYHEFSSLIGSLGDVIDQKSEPRGTAGVHAPRLVALERKGPT